MPRAISRTALPAPRLVTSQSYAQSIHHAALVVLKDVPPDAVIEVVSLTRDPAATFSTSRPICMDVSGYNPVTRTATLSLTPEICRSSGFKPGDRLLLRQVSGGQASPPIHVHLDPAPLSRRAAQGPVILEIPEGIYGTIVQPRPETDKRLAGPAVDEYQPRVREDRLSLVAHGGEVQLVLDGAVEPGARVRVQHLPSAAVHRLKLGDDQTSARVAIPGCRPGDILAIVIEDAARNAAAPLVVTWVPSAPRGMRRAKMLDVRMSSRPRP